jgi:hypothetical protein
MRANQSDRHEEPCFTALTLPTSAMGEPVAQGEPQHAGRSSDQPQAADDQTARTPAQLIAEDFHTLAQDHATAGIATTKWDH